MAVFRYRAADNSGKAVEGTMESDTEQRVVARLHDMGFIPLRIALPDELSQEAFRTPFPGLTRKKVTQRELLYFTQELGTLLKAGLPLDRSLSMLAGLVRGEGFKRILGELLEGVRAGKSLAVAMADHPGAFPRLYVNMIRAGEQGGVLGEILSSLQEYLERSLNLKDEIRSALTYPIILLVVAGFSMGVLFVYVIPRFSLLFKDVRQALPFMTIVLIETSAWLSMYGWIGILVLIAAFMAGTFYVRTQEGRLNWDRFQLRLWLLRDLISKLEAARFARTMAALIKGGVPILDALGTVQGVMGNRIISQGLAQVQIKVKEGKGMAGALAERNIFPAMAIQMISVGEETGEICGMLSSIADYYDQEVKKTVKRITLLLEPVLILGMGLLIGVIVISMLMAIFSINELPF